MRKPSGTTNSDNEVEASSPSLTPQSRRPWWRRKRYFVLVALASWYAWPVVNPFSPQDRCEFGTGSTALHERMKDEVRAYLAENGRVWLKSYSYKSSLKFREDLSKQVVEFAMQRPTVTERTAAMHSLFRAYHMEFRRNRPTRIELDGSLGSPYFLSTQFYEYRSINYALNPFCPICYLLFYGGSGTQVIGESAKIGDYRVKEDGIGLRLFLTTDWSYIAAESSGLSCPEVLR